MGESGFALALDVGISRVKAVLVGTQAQGAVKVTTVMLAGDRPDIGTMAFVTDSGEVRFGEEAEDAASSDPERAVRDVMHRIGDGVPLVVGGFAIPAEQMFAELVSWVVEVASAQHGGHPNALAIVHPTRWRGHRVAAVSRALAAVGIDAPLLLPSASAALEHDAAARSPGRIVGVYDLGASTFEASVFRDGSTPITTVSLDRGGSDVDRLLLRHVLGMLRGGRRGSVHNDLAPGELAAIRRSVVSAKETLSARADASIEITAVGHEATLRVTRSEVEAITAALIDETADAFEQALDDAGVSAADLDEILLVGGSARIPLVAQVLSERLDRPIVMPEDPQFAAAQGAAVTVCARYVAALPAAAAEAEEQATAFARPRLSARRRGPVGRRILYGGALAVSAAAVSAGVLFGATTPLAVTSDSADSAQAESGGGAGDLAPSIRTAGRFDVTPAAVQSGPVSPVEEEGTADRPPSKLAAKTPPPASGEKVMDSQWSTTTTPVDGTPPVSTVDDAQDPSTTATEQTPDPTSVPTTPPGSTPSSEPTPQPTVDPTPEPTPEPTTDQATPPASEPTPPPAPEPTPTTGPTPTPADPTPDPTSTTPPPEPPAL